MMGVDVINMSFGGTMKSYLIETALEDAAFAVYKDGKKITNVVTDNAGCARISGLSEGYYEIEETAAPKGYVLDKTRHGVHIDPYNPATEDDPVLVVTNERKPGLIIEKLDSETLKPMKGTTFAVYKGTKLIGEYKTNADGMIELTDIETGIYTVKLTPSNSNTGFVWFNLFAQKGCRISAGCPKFCKCAISHPAYLHCF